MITEGYSFDDKIRNSVNHGRLSEEEYEITLNSFEMELVKMVVKQRLRLGDARGLKTDKDMEKQLNFVGAELAFAKLFNIYMDFGRQYRAYDHVMTLRYPGRTEDVTIDVKHTHQERGHLTANIETKEVCDFYVLMVGQFPTFVYRGCIPGDVFIREENIKQLGAWRGYAVEQHRLSIEFF